MFGWMWLVAGADLLLEKSSVGWWLMLIWFERKALLADKPSEQCRLVSILAYLNVYLPLIRFRIASLPGLISYLSEFGSFMLSPWKCIKKRIYFILYFLYAWISAAAIGPTTCWMGDLANRLQSISIDGVPIHGDPTHPASTDTRYAGSLQ